LLAGQFVLNVRGIFNTLQEADSKLADNGKYYKLFNQVQLNYVSNLCSLIFCLQGKLLRQMNRVFSKEIGRGISSNALASWSYGNMKLFFKGKIGKENYRSAKCQNAFQQDWQNH